MNDLIENAHYIQILSASNCEHLFLVISFAQVDKE